MAKRVLVVDDEAPIRSTLARVLGRPGYEVVGAGTLSHARATLPDLRPHLVLLDLQLPDGHGLDLLPAVEKAVPDGDVIVMTGMDDLSVAIEAMRAGAYDFLTKPLEPEALLEVVERCFQDQVARRTAPEMSDVGIKPQRLIGRDPGMVEAFKLMGMAATSRSPVLIRGESGTGKELVARSIHRHQMPDRPFVAVNCAALPDGLLESELFGHERGAFTGASTSRKGSLELAGEGTLLLDEIGDTTPSFQTKLLRVLQDGEYARLGAERTQQLRARVMAATHRPLEEMIDREEFRSDLYFRLRVIEITVPPLSKRRGDIPRLARYLLASAASRLEKAVHRIPSDVMEVLVHHDWPGNVREMENAVTRAVALAKGPAITADGLGLKDGLGAGGPSDDGSLRGAGGQLVPTDSEALEDIIRAHTRAVLERTDGNKREAARRLDISPARLYRILDEEG